jgi:hypothetical protein
VASWQANLLFKPILVHRGIYEAVKGIYSQLMPVIVEHVREHKESECLQFTGQSFWRQPRSTCEPDAGGTWCGRPGVVPHCGDLQRAPVFCGQRVLEAGQDLREARSGKMSV